MRAARLAVRASLLLLAVGVVALLLAFAVSRGLGRDAIRAAVEAELSRQLGTSVRIASLEGPLIPRLAVRGVQVGPEAAPGVSAERLEIRFDPFSLLFGGAWTFDSVSAEGLVVGLVRSPAGAWEVPLGVADGDRGDSDAEGELPALRVRRLTLSRSRLELAWGSEGRLSLEAELEASELLAPVTAASLREAEATLTVRFDGPSSAGVPLDEIELAAVAEGGRATLTRGVARGRAGRFDLEGDADLATWLEEGETGAVRLRARIAELDLGEALGRPALSSTLTGHASAELRRPPQAGVEAGLDVALEGSAGETVESVELQASWADGRWSLLRGDVRGTGVEVSVRGSGDADAIDQLKALVRVPDLAVLAGDDPQSRTEGDVELDVELSGPMARPVGLVSARGRRLAVRGVRLGELDARLAGAGDGDIRIESLSLSGGLLPLRLLEPGRVVVQEDALAFDELRFASDTQTLSVRGAIGRDFVRDVHVDAQSLDVAAIARLAGLPVPLAGLLGVRLRVDGDLPLPDVEGEAEWQGPGVDAVELEQLSAVFDAGNGRLGVVARIREARAELVRVEGTLPYDESALDPATWLVSDRTSLTLRTQSIDLSRFATLLPPDLENPGGRLRVELDVTGGRTPAARGLAELSGGRVTIASLGRAIEPVRGSLRIEPHERGIASHLELDAAGQQITARGSFDGRSWSDATLEVRSVDASWAAVVVPAARDWGGRVDASVSLEGPMGAPRIAGNAQWRQPELSGVELDEVAATFERGSRRQSAQLVVRAGGGEVLRAETRGPSHVTEPDEWLKTPDARLTLHGEGVQLALLQPFVSRRIRGLRGSVDFTAEARGGAAPDVRGTLVVEGGGFDVPLLRQSFAPIDGRLALTQEFLEIEQLRVGTAQAGAELRGRIDWADSAMDVGVELDALPFARSPALKAAVSGDVTANGPFDALQVRGAVEIHDLVATLGEEADTALREIRVLSADSSRESALRETRATTPGVYDRAAIDLGLALRRNSWLRGRGASLELAGDIQLRKPPLQPLALVGKTEVVRGSYVLHSKRFDVRQGTATFDGGAAVDPVLDVEAAHPVRDVTVLLFLTGRASASTLRIASEPAMSESDALAYLFLGRPADQVGASQRTGMESAAGALAAGVAADQVSTLVTQALPIDSLDVTMDETGKPAEVKVGKYVSDRLFVRYGRTLGPEPEDDVRLELRINRHWSVGTDVSTDDSAGADVIWSLDY